MCVHRFQLFLSVIFVPDKSYLIADQLSRTSQIVHFRVVPSYQSVEQAVEIRGLSNSRPFCSKAQHSASGLRITITRFDGASDRRIRHPLDGEVSLHFSPH